MRDTAAVGPCWRFVVIVLLLLLGGCNGGGKSGIAVTTGASTAPVTTTSAAPTGSGSALSESYSARCKPSLKDEPLLRANGEGTLTEIRLKSPDSSHTLRSIYVYRPGGIKDSSTLPIVYLLHGHPGNPADLWTKYDGKKILDEAFQREAAAHVVVTLDGRGTKHSDTEWADSVDGVDKVESFILHVAIPAVEGRHARDACHRAVVGFSMGGYGAVNLAQRHPDVFGQAVSVAGYFHVDDPDHVFNGDAAVEKANSPDQQVVRMKGLRVFLLEAGQENLTLVKGEAARFAKLLVADKIPVTLDYSPGTHTGDYAVAQQPEVAGFLQTGWQPQP